MIKQTVKKTYVRFRHPRAAASVREKQATLQRMVYADPEDVASTQLERFNALVRHAIANVPYYNERLRHLSQIPENELRLSHLEEMPLLSKNEIRSEFEHLKSRDLDTRRWHYETSGGSTGVPVRFIHDSTHIEWNTSVKNVFDDWTGYRPGMHLVKLWGSERDLLVGRETMKTTFYRWLDNNLCLNAFRMSRQQMRAYLAQINQYRPVQILAYAESIYNLAVYAENENIRTYKPKAIVTSAGTLYAFMRDTIERVFECAVFNRYGSREVGSMASECEQHCGLHVSPITHILEILRQDGSRANPGEPGEIVVTCLGNYAMPLIRFRIGDVGTWAEKNCECGSGWPLLQDVKGRVSDIFVTVDGSEVHGEYFTHLFYFRDWVEKFQIVQENVNSIRIKIVKNSATGLTVDLRAEQDDISSKIGLVMGKSCQVIFEYVNDIAPTESGKFRFTISNVDRAELK